MDTRQNILDELKDLDSSLVQRPARSPFKVPEGFFAGQEESLSENIFSSSDLSIDAGELVVPDDFFKTQRESIKASIKSEEAEYKRKKRSKLRVLVARAASLAAILCMVAAGAFYLSTIDIADSSLTSMDSIDDDAILEYLSMEEDMEEMLLASAIDLDDEYYPGLDDAAISDYLLDEELYFNELLDDEYYDIY